MNKYKFNIEEILNKEVTIEAEDFDQAIKIIISYIEMKKLS